MVRYRGDFMQQSQVSSDSNHWEAVPVPSVHVMHSMQCRQVVLFGQLGPAMRVDAREPSDVTDLALDAGTPSTEQAELLRQQLRPFMPYALVAFGEESWTQNFGVRFWWNALLAASKGPLQQPTEVLPRSRSDRTKDMNNHLRLGRGTHSSSWWR